ncbi:FecR domain-containing protein [Methylosinus sp. Sm6]|uniref:FecR family protein n=1 Tax=Methylosinus sp. Sm6 TaxID=2866948 RepID=UPI001C999A41|nr:FecR domain-containing protein [Methylosinus sp. Sm6]MBY6240997.1 FecR domain-containing protein [Methylosinus sp. Sm6]
MTKERRDVHDLAIDWWLRQNDGPRLTKAETAALDEWLAASETHRAAFDEVAKLFGHMAQRWPGAGPVRRKRRTKRRIAGAAGAAAIAALLLFADAPTYLMADHYAGIGEGRAILLEDGSRVELDSRSAVALRYSGKERRIALLVGEAWFDVAPDASRPFVVEAAGGAVTALGTAFDVCLERETARIAVGQHRVEVTSGGRDILVEEGRQTVYAKGAAPQAPADADVEQLSAWRRRQLMFENKPLGDVVDALARYRRGLVLFADPALRARRVTGVFRTDDPLAALRQIESALGLHAIYLTRYLIIIKS